MQTDQIEVAEITRVCTQVQSTLEIKTPPAEKQPLADKYIQHAIKQVAKMEPVQLTAFATACMESGGLSKTESVTLHLATTDLLWVYRNRELRSVFCTQDAFAQKMHSFDIDTNHLPSAIQYIDQFIAVLKSQITDESLNASLNPFIIHFSQKLTNTKAFGGVFVPASRKSKLPYLFSGSLQETVKRNLLADITIKNNASTVIDKFNKGDSENAHLLNWYNNKEKNEVNCNYVDTRLTQLLLPKADGSYVSVTPLSAGGMLAMLNDASFKAAETKGEKGEHLFSGTRLDLPVGGANPVNVSLHTSNIQKAWLHKTPEHNYQIRRAFSVLYQGFSINFDKEVLKSYAAWLNDPKEFMNDRDTLMSQNLELKTSPLYKLVSKIADDVNAAMDDFNGTREQIESKLTDGEINPMGDIEQCIFNGVFDESSLTELVNIIINRLSMNSDDVPIAYSEQTKSRHKSLIFQILKENINYTLGVSA